MTEKRNYLSKAERGLLPEKPIFTQHQIDLINAKTPKSEIDFTYKSVKAAYVKKRLTLIFGWDFDFIIKSREFLQATKEVLVEGRLTIRTQNDPIIREQFGQHYTNTATDLNDGSTTTHPSDIGNGYKAAATDALKKCASELGLFWDIYGQEHSDQKKAEQPEPDHAEKKILERLEHFLSECSTVNAVEKVYKQYSDNHEENQPALDLYRKHIARCKLKK